MSIDGQIYSAAHFIRSLILTRHMKPSEAELTAIQCPLLLVTVSVRISNESYLST